MVLHQSKPKATVISCPAIYITGPPVSSLATFQYINHLAMSLLKCQSTYVSLSLSQVNWLSDVHILLNKPLKVYLENQPLTRCYSRSGPTRFPSLIWLLTKLLGFSSP